jgi:MFS family permease
MSESKKRSAWLLLTAVLAMVQILHLVPYFLVTISIRKIYGDNAGIAGVILIASGILAKLVTGRLLSQIEPKRVLVFSLGITVIAAASYKLQPQDTHLWVSIRIFHGIAFGLALTSVNSVAKRLIPLDKTNTGMSLLSSSIMIAYALAASIGVRINEHPNTMFNVGIASALSGMVLAGVMCICILPTMPPAPKSTNKWFIGSVGPFAFMAAGVTTYYGAVSAYLPATLPDKSAAQEFILLMTVANVIMYLVAGPLANKQGNYWVTVVSMFTLGASIFALAFKLVTLAAILVGIGFGLVSNALLGAVMKKVDSTEGGAASATYFTGYDTGTMLSFFTGNLLIQQSTYSPIMWSVYLIPVGLALASAQRYRSLF